MPFYFGSHLRFIEYQLNDDRLLASYRALRVLPILGGLQISLDEVRPIARNEVIQLKTHELIRGLDYIISHSSLPQLYRLPYGAKIFQQVRMNETLYSFEILKAGANKLIRLVLVYKPFFRESQQPYADALIVALSEYCEIETKISKSEMSGPRNWRGRKVIEIEVKLLV